MPRVGSTKELYEFIKQYLRGKKHDSAQYGKDETVCKIICPEKNDNDIEKINLIPDVEESKTLKRAGGSSTDQTTHF